MFDEASKQLMNDSVLCWLATVDGHGAPSVSPKEMFVPLGDDRLLIAHIASPNSVANIRTNPNVCVSLLDIFRQKGCKLYGKANLIHPGDAQYDSLLDALQQVGGTGFPVLGIIDVHVERLEPIIAPSYWMFPETTSEQSQIEQSMKTYGVRPAGPAFGTD